MSQRETVSTQQEFNDRVLLGKKIVDTDFTFNMAIGLMDGFPSNRTIIFFNCTFRDISVQFLHQSRITFTQCTIEQLVICDGGTSQTMELTDSVIQSIQLRDGGFINNLRISGTTTQSISFSATSAANVLSISKFSKIGILNIGGCQGVLETISIVGSKITDVFIEYSDISNQLLIRGDQSINSISIYSSDFTEFVIDAPVNTLLIEGDGLRRYSMQRLRLASVAVDSNSSITFTRVDFTRLDLTGVSYSSEFSMNDVTISNLIAKRAMLTNSRFNNISIITSLTS